MQNTVTSVHMCLVLKAPILLSACLMHNESIRVLSVCVHVLLYIGVYCAACEPTNFIILF